MMFKKMLMGKALQLASSKKFDAENLIKFVNEKELFWKRVPESSLPADQFRKTLIAKMSQVKGFPNPERDRIDPNLVRFFEKIELADFEDVKDFAFAFGTLMFGLTNRNIEGHRFEPTGFDHRSLIEPPEKIAKMFLDRFGATVPLPNLKLEEWVKAAFEEPARKKFKDENGAIPVEKKEVLEKLLKTVKVLARQFVHI